VEKIEAGVKQGKLKDQDFMAAGNAIERVHKNILEFRNYMLNEKYFPYVVFLQGSNFATESFVVNSPDGRKVKLIHNAGDLNRIDRVTASNYGMEINKNYCENITITIRGDAQMLQIPSLFFQCNLWSAGRMAEVMWDIALTSLKVLEDEL
jgi:type II restriction enzyme